MTEQKTLRDEFAMAALGEMREFDVCNPDDIAAACYQIADAMMKEREK